MYRDPASHAIFSQFPMQVVIANILQERNEWVTIVTPDEYHKLSVTDKNWTCSIEELIIAELVTKHTVFIVNNASE